MALTELTQKIICIIVIYCSTLYGAETPRFPAGIAQRVSCCPNILVPVHISSNSYQLSDAVLRGVIWNGADQPRYLIYEQFGKARRDMLFYAIQALGGLAATKGLSLLLEHTWKRKYASLINVAFLMGSATFVVASSGLALLHGLTSLKVATTRKHDDPSIDPAEDDILLSDSDSLHLKQALGLSNCLVRRNLYCKQITQDRSYNIQGKIYYVPLFQVTDNLHATFAEQQQLINIINAIKSEDDLTTWCSNFNNDVGSRLQRIFSGSEFKSLSYLEPYYTKHIWDAINDPHGYSYHSESARDTEETDNYRVPTIHGKILVSPKLRNALQSMFVRVGLRYTEHCAFVSTRDLFARPSATTSKVQPFTGHSQVLGI